MSILDRLHRWWFRRRQTQIAGDNSIQIQSRGEIRVSFHFRQEGDTNA